MQQGLDLNTLFVATMWGAFLGVLYFGGLWMSLRSTPGRSHPRRSYFLQYLLRLAVALAGFWLAMQHGPAALVCSVIGFIGMRVLMVRRLGLRPAERGGQHGHQS